MYVSKVSFLPHPDCYCTTENRGTPEHKHKPFWQLDPNSDELWNLGNMLPSIRRAAATTEKSDRILESGTRVDYVL